jgi:dipeptide/tripeptide permease
MQRRRLVVIGSIVTLAIAAGLWFFPSIVFPKPGVNDAILLADLTLPLVGMVLLADIVLVLIGNGRRWSTAAPLALGIYLLGVVLAFVVGSNSFANMAEDRFDPLFYLPGLFLIAGIVVLIVGLRRRIEGSARAGMIIGGMASALLVVWMVVRGPRDWLRAPYGFDILLLIAFASVVVYVAGAAWRLPISPPPEPARRLVRS